MALTDGNQSVIRNGVVGISDSVMNGGGLGGMGMMGGLGGAGGVTVAAGSRSGFVGWVRGRVMVNGAIEKVVERRQRRMIKNRESAARSRARNRLVCLNIDGFRFIGF
ncbi:putative transcription factor bZIP family [Helianthus annuus]|nr:putative transcription factor bZIP family [Helianthus annuus]